MGDIVPNSSSSLPKGERRSLTPTPLRMERGVDSIIYKQRGRFFDVKRRPFHCKETPSSNGEGRSFVFTLSPTANEVLPRYIETI